MRTAWLTLMLATACVPGRDASDAGDDVHDVDAGPDDTDAGADAGPDDGVGDPCSVESEGFETCPTTFCNSFTGTCALRSCAADGSCPTGFQCGADGETCEKGPACANGSCPDPDEACWQFGYEGIPAGCPTVCAPPPVEGQICTFLSDSGEECLFFVVDCAAPLECVALASPDAPRRCTPTGGVGSACHSNEVQRDGCDEGLTCQLTTLGEVNDGTCQPLAGEGEVCAISELGDSTFLHRCADGFVCNDSTVEAERTTTRCGFPQE